MTTLRPQLRFARQAYRSARYPGDLASELLPKPGLLQSVQRRRRMLLGTAGASAVAAAVMISVLISRVSDLSQPIPHGETPRALVEWFPNGPDGIPLPTFRAPALPRALHLDVPEVKPAVDRYEDLAVQYRKLRELTPDLQHMDVKVPKLSDLPTRSVEWLGRVWHDEPAESV
jgi:hypothetical protein